jgi:hypothetical protein
MILLNLCLLFLLLAKVAVLCGFAPAALLLIFADRIQAIGFEQVPERAVSQFTSVALSDGNKPAPEVMARAA